MSVVDEIVRNNKEILAGIVTDKEVYLDFLDVMAQHTGRADRRVAEGKWAPMDNQSVLNCAAIQASSYDDTREALTEGEWKTIAPGASVREGEPGIPVVKMSRNGKTAFPERLFPASAMEGLDENRFHNYVSRVDLSDDVDSRCWDAAVGSGTYVIRPVTDEGGKRVFADGKAQYDRVPVAFDELDPTTSYVVRSHFGIADDDARERAWAARPPEGVRADMDALKAHFDGIKRDAGTLIEQLDRAMRKERKAILEPSWAVTEEAPARAEEGPARSEAQNGREPFRGAPDRGEAVGAQSVAAPAPVSPVPARLDGMSPAEARSVAVRSASSTAPAEGARAVAMGNGINC